MKKFLSYYLHCKKKGHSITEETEGSAIGALTYMVANEELFPKEKQYQLVFCKKCDRELEMRLDPVKPYILKEFTGVQYLE